jgi:hypothetical protein
MLVGALVAVALCMSGSVTLPQSGKEIAIKKSLVGE